MSNHPVSIRAFARSVGVSHPAVIKAVKSGRLRASVEMVEGKPRIVDADLAREEWRRPAPIAATPPRAGMAVELERDHRGVVATVAAADGAVRIVFTLSPADARRLGLRLVRAARRARAESNL